MCVRELLEPTMGMWILRQNLDIENRMTKNNYKIFVITRDPKEIKSSNNDQFNYILTIQVLPIHKEVREFTHLL